MGYRWALVRMMLERLIAVGSKHFSAMANAGDQLNTAEFFMRSCFKVER